MNLTPEQLEQCRKDFEEDYSARYPILSEMTMSEEANISLQMRKEEQFAGFQAAWRPIPSVKEIEKLVDQGIEDFVSSPTTVCDSKPFIARAIHRKLGDKE